jgi:uncharacterized membrane protein
MVGWIVIGAGFLVMGLSWAGKVGKLPRNYFAGIRLPSTLRSDEAWAAGHRAAGTTMIVSSLFLVAMGVRILMMGVEESEDGIWWFAGPMLGGFLIATVQAHRAAKAATRD